MDSFSPNAQGSPDSPAPDSPAPDSQLGSNAATVVVVGSLNIDLTVRTERFPEPGETLAGSELVSAPGGKGSNLAVAAAILGSRVRLIGAVGDDSFGAFLLTAAEGAGVDIAAVQRLDGHATGSALIVVNAEGENTIIVSAGANGALAADTITADALNGAAVVCLNLEIPIPTVQAAAQAGHLAGAQVLLNLSPYQEIPSELLRLTDVLLVNQAEAGRLLGSDQIERDWAATAADLSWLGIDRAIVTLGSDGCVVLDGTAPVERDRVRAIGGISVTAVDTTGCGDAFAGALAARLAAAAPLVPAARFAVKASALAATASGAQSSYQAFAYLRS